MRCRVIFEKKFSTALSQEAEVGVEVESPARIARQPIVGLYVDPPAHAVVLSIDEKSQIQALDRTQPGLPIKPERCQTLTHDYKRHGTATSFTAASVLEKDDLAS
jgi:hypothetical protein